MLSLDATPRDLAWAESLLDDEDAITRPVIRGRGSDRDFSLGGKRRNPPTFLERAKRALEKAGRGFSRSRWRSLLAIGAIAVGVVWDLAWVWGLLFLAWAIIDLRNRVTYLLDEIPRDRSPALYWTTIVLWFGLAFWSLGFLPEAPFQALRGMLPPGESTTVTTLTPAAGDTVEETAVPAPSSRTAPSPNAATASSTDPTTKTAQPPATLVNERFSFAITPPKGWTQSLVDARESSSFELARPDGAATISAIGMDTPRGTRVDELVAYMEEELHAELPFVTESGRRASAARDEAAVLARRFEYFGAQDGYELVAVVAYGVRGSHAYTLLGVCVAGDEVAREEIESVFASFTLEADSESR